jgi:drug/metabolite transporter (DMT)-like permease
METVILATTTAALFGFSDFFGGLASRKDTALAVTARAYLLGVVVMAAAVLLFPARAVTPYDLAWGIAGGLCGGLGVMSLYAALACGRMSIVAPTTAALSGSLPALFDLVRGTAIRPLALVGLGLAIVAVVIVSMTAGEKEEHELPRRALVLSIASGVLFAGAFLSFSFAGRDSGFAPLVAARVVSGSLLTVLAYVRLGRVRLHGGALAPTLGAGVLDALATVSMITAIRVGPLAIASVLGSLYPVVTILLARFVLGERLRGLQRVGIALALAAVLMAALG